MHSIWRAVFVLRKPAPRKAQDGRPGKIAVVDLE
jgi:hypothetical protein